MYNLIEYSSNYSETTRSLWFHSKDETNNLNDDIVYENNFKPFEYKAELLGNTGAQPAPNAANGILRNAAIAVPLKYLSNFWRSLKMSLINCKVELKLRWKKHCVLSLGGADNVHGNDDDDDDDDDDDNIIFIIKDTKLYVLVVTFSARDNQKLSKLLRKGFQRSTY